MTQYPSGPDPRPAQRAEAPKGARAMWREPSEAPAIEGDVLQHVAGLA